MRPLFVLACYLTADLLIYSATCATNPAPLPTSSGNDVSLPPLLNPPFPSRRVFPSVRLDKGWRVQAAAFESILPASTSAPLLDYFYQDIIRWTSATRTPETGLFRFRVGILTLEFQCAQSAITWYFVQRFAEMMLRSTRQGFTGAYQLFYTHVEGIRIMVALYIDL